MAPRAERLILVCLVLFFVGATSVWLCLDRTPPSWDDAYYLNNSLILHDSFADGGIGSLAQHFLHEMKSKPPLIAVLPIPVYWVAGRRIRAAYAVNLFFMLVLFGVLFHLGKKYAGIRAGLLAVFIAGTMPMLYGLSHWFLVECSLGGFVCIAICIVAGFDQQTAWSKCALLGVIFGLGLLMKMSFPLYIAVPMIYFGARNSSTLLKPKALTAFTAAAAFVAMPWYLSNFASVLHTALKAGSAPTAMVYATGDVLSWSSILSYLVKLSNAGPAIYFLLLVLLGALFTSRLSPSAKKGMLLCGLWGSPVLFLVFGHYRDLRYAAPLFPAAALGLAILIEFAASGRGIKAWVLVCAVLFLPLASMLQNSFGILGRHKFELGGLLLVERRFEYARKYDRAEWPQQEILFDMFRQSKTVDGRREPVILGTDSRRFNADNFQLAATRGRLPFEFASTAYEADRPALISALHSTSYFIYKDAGEPDAPNFNPLGRTAIQEVRESGSFRELPLSRALPDGGVAHVFVNRAIGVVVQSSAFVDAGFKEMEDCNVTFADEIQLTGCSAIRTAQGLDVRLRWRCLKPINRDYWCFAHILDQSGRVIGYLDHQILNGNPPTSEWKPGDVALERLFFLSKTRPLRLRLGLFDRGSGERLRISISEFPLTDNQSAAILGEKVITTK